MEEETRNSGRFADDLLAHRNMLRAWLCSRFPRLEVDDVVQEAYFRVIKAHADRPVKAPKAFLFATARNIAINTLKSASVRGEDVVLDPEELEFLDESEGVVETIAKNQELEFLTQAIQRLPRRCRRIFTLNKVYGMPPKEVARELGLSITTVYAQLSIGIAKCVEELRRIR